VVDDGEVILVTDYGHPIAKIVQAKAQRAISTA
jgi:antitoxin (DNA-binding transcriptional repressor) of toxin-antitoxin stability system